MKLQPAVLAGAGLLLAAGVMVGLVFGANRYLEIYNTKSGVADCTTTYMTHVVIIKDDLMVPHATYAKLCDRLVITNTDNRIRLVAFGPHDHHVTYDGVTEKGLGHSQSLTITLNRLGTYNIHDHLEDEVSGSFTVTTR